MATYFRLFYALNCFLHDYVTKLTLSLQSSTKPFHQHPNVATNAEKSLSSRNKDLRFVFNLDVTAGRKLNHQTKTSMSHKITFGPSSFPLISLSARTCEQSDPTRTHNSESVLRLSINPISTMVR